MCLILLTFVQVLLLVSRSQVDCFYVGDHRIHYAKVFCPNQKICLLYYVTIHTHKHVLYVLDKELRLYGVKHEENVLIS